MATKPPSGSTINNSDAQGLATSLDRVYALLEGSGTTTADSKNSITGTFHSPAVWSSDTAGACVSSTGPAGYISLASSVSYPTTVTQFSIAWGCTKAASDNLGQVCDPIIMRNSVPDIHLTLGVGGPWSWTPSGSMTSYHDYLLVWDMVGMTVVLYEDGVSLGSFALSAGNGSLTINALLGNNGSNNFNGKVDYLYVWKNRALTASDAANLHTNPYEFFPSTGLSVSPTTAADNTSQSITLTGFGTHWTTSSPTFSLIGGNTGGASISGVTIVTDTSATATLTTGTTAGTLTIKDSTTGGTCAFTVTDTGGSITISTPVIGYVAQRDGAGHASLTISGTGVNNGASTNVEANFNGGPFATIQSGYTGGAFSGTLATQSQGQGIIVVRLANNHAVQNTIYPIGIGDVFLDAGQSNSCAPFTVAQTYVHASLTPYAYPRNVNAWQVANDPCTWIGPFSGSIWPLLATIIMQDQGVPVGFVTAGQGSTGLTEYSSTNPNWTKFGINSSGGDMYSSMQTLVTGSAVNAFKAILWIQGENDADGHCPRGTYAAWLLYLFQNLKNDITGIGGAPKVLPVVFGYSLSNVVTADGLTISDEVHIAIVDAAKIAESNGYTFRPFTILDQSNAEHPSSGGNPDNPIGIYYAARFWATVYGGFKSLIPTSAFRNAAKTQIQVRFDSALKTGLTMDASLWSVVSNGSPATVSSVAYATDPNSILLNFASALTDPITLGFALGTSTAGKVFPQTTNISMPAGLPGSYPTTITLPALPLFNFPVDPNPGGGGGVSNIAMVGGFSD
jgi:hypothetical protein